MEWLTDHHLLMNSKNIKEYKETGKKEKMWDKLGRDLVLTGRHKFIFYLLLLVPSQS